MPVRARNRRCGGSFRWALVTVAAMLSSALVVSGPAGAANTASEFLTAPADQFSTQSSGGVRPFAGDDRYETAVLLAERFAHELGGLGAVSTVILVSGAGLADGLSAAGLAGQHQAPILLTPPDALGADAAGFIDRYDVSTVIAVGGIGVISDRVLRDVASLAAEPTVRRVAGTNRYATAAAVASELHSDAAWCGKDGSAALLLNGSDELLADAGALSSLAYARSLPIVLTGRDELPEVTARYLRSERIDRVVILGGTSAVSDAVISPLLAAGVDDVTRVAVGPVGTADAAAALLMTHTCADELQPSKNLVALAGRRAALDAVVAGPLLGTGLDGSGPVPLLRVDSRLSAVAHIFLARTPNEIDGRKNHVQIVAIGGPDAVAQTAVDSAVHAAASARALTATITATAGESKLRVSYSENLEVDRDRFVGKLRDLLYVNDFPAWIAGQPTVTSATADPCEMFSSLDVTLHRELEAGDRIELLEADGWYSTNGDLRTIRGAAYIVPEPRLQLGAPRVTLIALPGAAELWVSVKASQYSDPERDAEDGITLHERRIRVVAHDGSTVVAGDPVRLRLDRFLGTALYSFPLSTADGRYALAPQDRLIALSGLAVNEHRQRSRGRAVVVSAPPAPLSVTAVRVGPPNPGVDDSERTTRPAEIPEISRRSRASLGAELNVVAKWSGVAAGAAGNAWRIHSTRADTPAGSPGDGVPATQVWVDPSRHQIIIRHINAPAGEQREQTYGELAELLNSNLAFSRHFIAELREPCGGDENVVDLDEEGLIGDAIFSGGISSASFLVTFNDYVEAYLPGGSTVIGADAAGELIDDILGGLIDDYGSSAPDVPADRVEVVAPVPAKEMLFRFTTEDPDHAIGQTIALRGNRIDIGERVAASYQPDDPSTDDIDEGFNTGRALFAVPSSDSRLLNDMEKGRNSG